MKEQTEIGTLFRTSRISHPTDVRIIARFVVRIAKRSHRRERVFVSLAIRGAINKPLSKFATEPYRFSVSPQTSSRHGAAQPPRRASRFRFATHGRREKTPNEEETSRAVGRRESRSCVSFEVVEATGRRRRRWRREVDGGWRFLQKGPSEL